MNRWWTGSVQHHDPAPPVGDRWASRITPPGRSTTLMTWLMKIWSKLSPRRQVQGVGLDELDVPGALLLDLAEASCQLLPTRSMRRSGRAG